MSTYLNYWFFDFGGILNLFGIDSVNILNTAWVFVLPALFGTGLRNGLYIFIFRQFFLGQPKDLEEAARIDGCGPFKTFIRIMVPLAGPAFVTVLLFSIVWHWNDFYSSSIYFTNEVKPISCMLQNLQDALAMGSVWDRNTTRYEVAKDGNVVDLTLLEFELLKFLAMQPGKVFNRETLLENVWGYEYFGDVRTVDVTVRRLREKIEDNPATPAFIMTKRGVGYYFNK